MHYCTVIITNKLPIGSDIDRIMEPFYENAYYKRAGLNDDGEFTHPEVEEPIFMWDWYKIGGRYRGKLKLKDGYVDSAKCSDILNYNTDDLGCFICIDDIDNNVIVRKRWDGSNWVSDKNFDKKYEEILSNHKEDGYITIIDIHD